MSEAKRLFTRAIEIGEKHFNLDHPQLAIYYSNLGGVEHGLGNLSEAKRLLRRAIEIYEKHFEADHPQLAIYYSNLSAVELDLGHLEEAILLTRKAFLIFLRAELYESAKGELNWLRKCDPNIEAFLAEIGITLPQDGEAG